MGWNPAVSTTLQGVVWVTALTVGAKKKFLYSTVLLLYLAVLLPYFSRTYALLSTYFRRSLIVLLPHPLTYCNCTTAVLSPYRTQPYKIRRRVRIFLQGQRTMLKSKMQAWKELEYVNCYWLNINNRNSMTV